MYELEIWGEFLVSHQNDMGYRQRTVLANMMDGYAINGKQCHSLLPWGLEHKGINEFQLVQRVLVQLNETYWRSAIVEYVLPVKLVGKTKKARAEFLGISSDKHHRLLCNLKEKIRAHQVAG